ncbi:SRPBCC family protein [Oxalobacteraceae bacterium]|nr:SRPBCC family protein [Oxalobacteraceae bacterium]
MHKAASAVKESIDLAAPAATVWACVGNYHGMAHWHPSVTRSEVPGATEGDGEDNGDTRLLVLRDGRSIREKLLKHSDTERRLRYSIVDSPFPFDHYVAELRVLENGPRHCRVTWEGMFTARISSTATAANDTITAEEIIATFYATGFFGLKQALGISCHANPSNSAAC